MSLNERTRHILGVDIWPNSLDHLVERSLQACDAFKEQRTRRPYVFACANPHSLAVAQRDSDFKRALDTADAVVADGVGLKLVASLSGRTVGPRITGSDYFASMMRALAKRNGRVGFFGSSPGVLAKLQDRCRREFPGVTVASVISPPFGDWSVDLDARYLEEIRAARLDVLWVGLTAPKQEKWVSRNLHGLSVGVVGSVGAVFDYFAGTVKRAPAWVCGVGLEWAYRLAREPTRLWQRNFVSGPQFVGLALSEAVRQRSRRHSTRAATRL